MTTSLAYSGVQPSLYPWMRLNPTQRAFVICGFCCACFLIAGFCAYIYALTVHVRKERRRQKGKTARPPNLRIRLVVLLARLRHPISYKEEKAEDHEPREVSVEPEIEIVGLRRIPQESFLGLEHYLLPTAIPAVSHVGMSRYPQHPRSSQSLTQDPRVPIAVI
ncbi:MAG: hypothetical protein M1825_001478 [Sarcosagium campestre]|nr:MAG: hypothetical protein M1825_001478 [Sarcosagium campestre]